MHWCWIQVVIFLILFLLPHLQHCTIQKYQVLKLITCKAMPMRETSLVVSSFFIIVIINSIVHSLFVQVIIIYYCFYLLIMKEIEIEVSDDPEAYMTLDVTGVPVCVTLTKIGAGIIINSYYNYSFIKSLSLYHITIQSTSIASFCYFLHFFFSFLFYSLVIIIMLIKLLGNQYIVDADLTEEMCMSARISIAINRHGKYVFSLFLLFHYCYLFLFIYLFGRI